MVGKMSATIQCTPPPVVVQCVPVSAGFCGLLVSPPYLPNRVRIRPSADVTVRRTAILPASRGTSFVKVLLQPNHDPMRGQVCFIDHRSGWRCKGCRRHGAFIFGSLLTLRGSGYKIVAVQLYSRRFCFDFKNGVQPEGSPVTSMAHKITSTSFVQPQKKGLPGSISPGK